jgi:hypothetical protein
MQASAKITYIHTFTGLTDTLEIRVDVYNLEAILNCNCSLAMAKLSEGTPFYMLDEI